MQYFIGIPIPKSYKTKLEMIRAEFKFFATEPHITLIPPNVLPDNDDFIKGMLETCKSIDKIQIKLGSIGQFGDRVLFTSVESEDLEYLHKSIYEDLNIPKETRKFVPHLTIAKQRLGRCIDLGAVRQTAENILPPCFEYTLKYLFVYKQPKERSIYVPYMKIPLEKSSQI